MANNGITDRVGRWVRAQEPGAFFTLREVIEGVNADGGEPINNMQASTGMSRLVSYSIGLERRKQGLYVWSPTGKSKKGSAAAPVRRVGPVPKTAPEGVTPLSIASGNTEAITVAEPTPAPAENDVPRTRYAGAPGPAAVADDGPRPETVDPKNRVPGTYLLLKVLAPLNGSGAFLAQNDDDGRVYSIREVDA